MKRSWILAVLVLVAGMSAMGWGGNEEPSSKLNFVVVRDYSGKPVKNASVILHPVNSKGKQERGGYELKTDSDGKTQFEGVPYGMLRVQVLAPGFQTFGEDYDVQKDEMEIVVRLKRPVQQYSIYGDSTNPPKQDGQQKEAPKEQEKPQ
jgi:hypothetical protein